MSLSLRQIRYFVAAADAGQISKAAIGLNVSQSAVTAAVKSLVHGGQVTRRDPHAWFA